jgi:hypothetical protein
MSPIHTSRRAFLRAQAAARLARFYRAEAKRALNLWERTRLIRSAQQCEARVRFMADKALRGAL